MELPTGLDELVDLALRVDARLQQRDLRGLHKFTPEYPSLDTGDTVSHSSVDEPMQVGRARLWVTPPPGCPTGRLFVPERLRSNVIQWGHCSNVA